MPLGGSTNAQRLSPMLRSAHAPSPSEPSAASREQGEAPPQGAPLRQGVHSSVVQGLRQQAGSPDQQHHIAGANELLHNAPVQARARSVVVAGYRRARGPYSLAAQLPAQVEQSATT